MHITKVCSGVDKFRTNAISDKVIICVAQAEFRGVSFWITYTTVRVVYVRPPVQKKDCFELIGHGKPDVQR